MTKDLPNASAEGPTPDGDYGFEPVPDSTESLRKKLREKRKTKRQQAKQPLEKPQPKPQPTVQPKSPKPKSPKPKFAKPEASGKSRFVWPFISRKLPLDSEATADPVANVPAKAESPPQRPRRRWLWGMAIAGGSLVLAGVGGWIALDRSLPDTRYVRLATTVPLGSITFKSLDGAVFYQSGPIARHAIAIRDIPQHLQEAFIATEDRRFYQHHGVDYQGIFRAIATNIVSRGIAEGGSTLTQQLARIAYLDQERSIIRKLREARLAQIIESKLSKSEILERYLNQVYLGSGAYGVGDAAWIYFSRPVEKLTLTQMATLAGLPAAPSLYSPLINPQAAQTRRDEVLDRMVRAGFISAAEARQAKQADLELKASPPPNLQDEAPYFSSYLKQQLAKVLPAATLKQGGLTVETTLNLQWQKAATQAVEDTVYLDGYSQGFDQAAMVSIEPQTGEIRTMVGGASFKSSQFNRVTQAQRQPGSTFKAFVYTAAIASGLSPNDGYLDTPFVVDGYKPKNYSNKYQGWVSMTTALTHSINIPAVRAIIDVGFEPTLNLAHAMGIKSKLDPFYSTALGGNEVNLLELTSAYGTLAAQGYRTIPHGIRRVYNRNAQVIYDVGVDRKQVLDSDSAAIMTWMLQHVVDEGTGVAAQLNRQVAGKTGTSEHARDLWFVGFIPQLTTGVWLGNDDNYPTYGSSGTAAYTWHELMKRVVQDLPAQKFPELPPLEGRKGSIKAKPVHPNNMHNISPEETGEKKEQIEETPH